MRGMHTDYRIVVRGRAGNRALDMYRDEFAITQTGTTATLRGPIIDAAHLHGLVSHLIRAGLELVEVAPSGRPVDHASGGAGT